MRTHQSAETAVPLPGGSCSSGSGSSGLSPGSDSDSSPGVGLGGGVGGGVRGFLSHYWSLESLHSTTGKRAPTRITAPQRPGALSVRLDVCASVQREKLISQASCLSLSSLQYVNAAMTASLSLMGIIIVSVSITLGLFGTAACCLGECKHWH